MMDALLWDLQNLSGGLDFLAQRLACSSVRETTARGAMPAIESGADIPRYLAVQGLEAMPCDTSFGELKLSLQRLSPGVIELAINGEKRFLLIAAARSGKVKLLAVAGGYQWVRVQALESFIGEHYGYSAAPEAQQLLQQLGLKGKRLEATQAQLTHQQYALKPVNNLWLIRHGAEQGLTTALHAEPWRLLVAGFMGAHLVQRVLLMASVGLLGYALANSFWPHSMVLTWGLIMLSILGCSLVGRSCQSHLEVRVGLIVKRQLQHAALRLSPSALNGKGPAALLGKAMEADGMQHNALPGVFGALNASLDLLLGLILALVLQQWLLAGLIILLLVAGAIWVNAFQRAYGVWADHRKYLSELTIAQMQGHRTRLLQSNPAQWHKEEERCLQDYWRASLVMDKFALRLHAFLPGAWLVVSCGLLCVAIMFALLSVAQLVVFLGVVLLVWAALDAIANSAQQLVRSWYSWREIRELLNVQSSSSQAAPVSVNQADANAELNINQLHYGYKGTRPLLQGVSLHLRKGQQYLLQGESGSGKSTLLSLLAGQAAPQQGWILHNDRDLPSLGYQYWRQKICWVPQYHDNYLFSAPLLFNLLLGRQWPPSQEDIIAAEIVCEKLGLVPLLQKMPGGILQSVGEMGWQLSQGERSRVFLARALLQQPDFLLLDESLGALDSSTSLQILSRLKEEPAAVLLCMHP